MFELPIPEIIIFAVVVIFMIAALVLLGIMLILNRQLLLKGKARAYMTIVVFVLVLFAILGATISGTTQHNFTGY